MVFCDKYPRLKTKSTAVIYFMIVSYVNIYKTMSLRVEQSGNLMGNSAKLRRSHQGVVNSRWADTPIGAE